MQVRAVNLFRILLFVSRAQQLDQAKHDYKHSHNPEEAVAVANALPSYLEMKLR